ncbi:hypothetical protein ACOZ4N_01410 (plasmid) [Halorientalis pallida]|uniref:hypothetical protein n=1 Tax=Halorientalis pallida TaxID=2479928 RepID=UPI003C6FE64A
MTDPAFPDGYYTTAEQFEHRYDGEPFTAAHPEKNHFECDFCSKGVPYAKEPRVGQYFADRLPYAISADAREVNQRRILTPLATYCEEHSYRRLLFPCKGYTEVRVFINLDENQMVHDPEITDISPVDDGIPWKPGELAEQITEVPPQEIAIFAGDAVAMGPENIVTFFLSLDSGIDIRQLVKWDGSINTQLLGQARRKYRTFAAEMRRSGWDKQHFRNRVRDR